MTPDRLARESGLFIRELAYPWAEHCYGAYECEDDLPEDALFVSGASDHRKALALLRDKIWKMRRAECAAKAGHRCENCGTPTPLECGEAHHETYRSHGGSMRLENLRWLCSGDGCHAIEHRQGRQLRLRTP